MKQTAKLTVRQQIIVCLTILERLKRTNREVWNEWVYVANNDMNKVFKMSTVNLGLLMLKKLKNVLGE